jgi:hypothetical protein
MKGPDVRTRQICDGSRRRNGAVLQLYVKTNRLLTYPHDIMKSKLTLRIDREVKEGAKTLARERGASVSAMVETYFRLLLREERDEATGSDLDLPDGYRLGSMTQRIAGALQGQEPGSGPHGDRKEDDRRVAVEAALKKHG